MSRNLSKYGVMAIFAANGLGIGAWAAAVAPLRERLGLSSGQLGAALFAFALGAALAMPLAGRVARQIDTRRAARVAAGVFVMALLLPSQTGSLAWLSAALFLLGAANGATDVLMNTDAARIEQAAGTAVLSSCHAAWSLGAFAGAALGGAVAQGGRPFFWQLAVPAGIAAGLLLLSMLARGGAPAKRLSTAHAPPGRPGAILGLLAVGTFGGMLAEGAAVDWSATYLRTVVGAGNGTASAGYGCFALAMTLCRLVGDRLVDRIGQRTVLLLGGVCATTGLTLVALAPSPVAACVGFALAGLGLANAVPVLFGAAARTGRNASSGVAIAATAGYLGFLAGPPLIGALAAALGLRSAFAVPVVAALVVTVAGATALRRAAMTPAVTARIEHVAIWTTDIDRLCRFYTTHLGATVGEPYASKTRPFRSRFLRFADGARLEVMATPARTSSPGEEHSGWAHIALRLGSPARVDAMVAAFDAAAIPVVGRPRRTGDGYYEAVIHDPDGNVVELMA